MAYSINVSMTYNGAVESTGNLWHWIRLHIQSCPVVVRSDRETIKGFENRQILNPRMRHGQSLQFLWPWLEYRFNSDVDEKKKHPEPFFQTSISLPFSVAHGLARSVAGNWPYSQAFLPTRFCRSRNDRLFQTALIPHLFRELGPIWVWRCSGRSASYSWTPIQAGSVPLDSEWPLVRNGFLFSAVVF